MVIWGKLPAHGDFIARGLTAGERDTLDAWLASSIADAVAESGAGSGTDVAVPFEARYDAAPPWRFAWQQQDGRWTAGALAPSVDAVGRRYPLLVGRRDLPGTMVDGAAAAAEAAIYRALSMAWTADQLAAAADDAPPEAGGAWTSGTGWWTVDAQGSTAARIEGVRPPGLIRAMVTLREGGAWA